MLKRTLLVENKSTLTSKNVQLVIKSEIRERTIPIEEIGFIVIDHPAAQSLLTLSANKK